jgi:signal transduction histidine kinase/ActR/RegA family two-component response regulator
MSKAAQEPRPPRLGLVPFTLILGGTALLILAAVVWLIGTSLSTITTVATDTRDRFLPAVLANQQRAVNLERMGRLGMTIASTSDPIQRRESRLATHILAQDASFDSDTRIQETVWNSYVAIREIAELRNRQDQIRWEMHQLIEDGFARLTFQSSDLPPDVQRRMSALAGEMRVLLAGVPLLSTHAQVVEQERRYEELFETMLSIPGGLPRDAVDQLSLLLDRLQKAYLFQDVLLRDDQQVQELWKRADTLLQEVSDSLSTSTEISVSERFGAIVDHASRSTILGYFSLGGMALIVLLLAAFSRHHILGPILRMTRGLQQIHSTRRAVVIPPPRLKELHAIQTDLEQFGQTLIELSERSAELQFANNALEREIAERRRTEQELARAKEAAEAADKAKSQFLASMSHEIRTPMNSILGMADLLDETELTDEQQSYVNVFKSSSETLLSLIDDILDLSKIEAGRLDLEMIEFDLRGTVQSVAKAMAFHAGRKGLEMVTTITPSVPQRVIGDPVRLRQILFNLLGNGVKFTEQGKVALTVDRPDPSTPGLLRFQVRDTGIGIPPDMQEHIFAPFTQADSSTTRKYGGTGLGLTISSRLAALMQGTIEVSSEPGKGALFTLTTRMDPVLEPSGQIGARNRRTQSREGLPNRKEGTIDPGTPRRVLLVEDSENNRMLILWFLKNLPYQVDVACNGQEAVELFKKHRYDIVLMDIQMPVMDGIGATRQIRALEREQGVGPTPILALSANVLKEDKHLCIEAGCTGYLAKPVLKGDMIEAIESFINAESSRRTS